MVVEREAKQVDFTAVRCIKRDFAIKVLIVEWQSCLRSIGIEELARLLQIRVLCRENEGNRRIIGGLGLLQRTFNHHLGAEAVGSQLTRETFLVAVTGRDVHDGGDTTAVFSTEAACVNVGVADDVGIKHREETDGMEGIVYHHTIKQHFVLNG